MNMLKVRQAYPLELKIEMSKLRIREWYRHYHGKVYVAFSGGKDSTVLLDLVRSEYPDVGAVFVNTGLEYPEIIKFVKTVSNVIWLKPKMSFRQTIEKYGFPVISKRQARFIQDIQNTSDKNKATVNLRLTGYNRKGNFLPSMKLSKKWYPLAYSDIKVSDKCCDVLKKNPLKKYAKGNSRLPFIGVMAHESITRAKTYLEKGCNSFSSNEPVSLPIAFWTEDDIWAYIRKNDLSYSNIYDMGETRTGCMFCLFGVHLEKSDLFNKNRFERMKLSHPKHYNYCIDKLGIGRVLDFINVNYGGGKMGKAKGHAKPGSTVTRKVSRGLGKGDTVQFKANSSSAREAGKLKPRRVIKDVAPKGTQHSLPKGKKKK